MTFQILHIYDYVTELQATSKVIQSHNSSVLTTGHGEAMHTKYIKLADVRPTNVR
jgi:hypothetical protein